MGTLVNRRSTTVAAVRRRRRSSSPERLPARADTARPSGAQRACQAASSSASRSGSSPMPGRPSVWASVAATVSSIGRKRSPAPIALRDVDLRPGGPERVVPGPERQLLLDPSRGEERVVDDLDVQLGVARARGHLDEVEHRHGRHGPGGVEDARRAVSVRARSRKSARSRVSIAWKARASEAGTIISPPRAARCAHQGNRPVWS